MKIINILCLAIILLLSACKGSSALVEEQKGKHHNKLDDVTSAAQIESIIYAINYSEFKVNTDMKIKDSYDTTLNKSCQHYLDSLNARPWAKADFDGNGYTDLLVVGSPRFNGVVCIMDSSENKFFMKYFERFEALDCVFPIVGEIDGVPVVMLHHEPVWGSFKSKPITFDVDTLVYKFDDFLKYNRTPAKHKIDKIEYSTGMCFGTCPIFSLTIHEDRSIDYHAERYNEQQGDFSTTIDEESFKILVDILNYLDVPNIDRGFGLSYTDVQHCTLKITYDNGKQKKISDTTYSSMYGISRVYELLSMIRETQSWKKR